MICLNKGIFAGASSGAVIAAIKKTNGFGNNTVALFPDRGDRYLGNLYNLNWIENNLSKLKEEHKTICQHLSKQCEIG